MKERPLLYSSGGLIRYVVVTDPICKAMEICFGQKTSESGSIS
jgi:hypothetical protein